MTIETGLLADHPEAVAPLVALLEAEWADWYHPQGASARSELSERSRRQGLPLGIVAMREGSVVGTCALTLSSGGLMTERKPWLGGLLVEPAARRQGVAVALLHRARDEARRQGYRSLYALTAHAVDLFQSQEWTVVETMRLEGEPHKVFATAT